MLKLLRFLITGSWHEHKWVQDGLLNSYSSASKGHRLPTAVWQLLRCKECGNLKRKRLL